MTYRGRVQKGVVVFDGGDRPADGTRVRVEPIRPPADADAGALSARLERLAGTAKGLPPDLARRHDHYLHGHPRS